MAILSMPNFTDIRSARFGPMPNTHTFISGLNRSAQTIEFSGTRWSLDVVLKPMKRAQAAAWLSFLAALDGMAGRFYAPDPDALSPRGTGGGTPLVNGGGQSGKSLITDGWNISEGVLLEGDYIAYDYGSGLRALHIVTADVTSDGSGNATIPIRPAIRTAPSDGASIIVSDPTCVMGLVDDEQARQPRAEDGFYRIAFSAVERFNKG